MDTLGMTANDYIDKAISLGITYRRQYINGRTKITFTRLKPTRNGIMHMEEVSFSVTDKDSDIAANLAFQAIKNK